MDTSILTGASVVELRRLLNLFPHNVLKQAWPQFSGRKEDLLLEIAGERDTEGIIRFISDNIGCCRQHVHLFHHSANLADLPNTLLPEYKPVFRTSTEVRKEYLHIIRTVYVVHLIEPYDRIEVSYLWPLKVEFTEGVCTARFVKLEKDLSAEFRGRHLRTETRSITDNSVVGWIALAMDSRGGIRSMDFNKGIKAWVDEEMIDGADVRMKDSRSTITRSMDEQYTMKRDLPPDAYEEFKMHPLQNCRFRVLDPHIKEHVSDFACDPTGGTINFLRFSNIGDTDYVIQQILQRN